MDDELRLLFENQLCLLLAQRMTIVKLALLTAQGTADALMLSRIDVQILRLREKGISL